MRFMIADIVLSFVLLTSNIGEAFRTPIVTRNKVRSPGLRMVVTNIDSGNVAVKLPNARSSQSSAGKVNPGSALGRLELDKEGRLRITDGPTIMEDLSPATWKGISAVSEEEVGDAISSLFLHTTLPAGSAQHALSLGSLVSCNKLLACARLTRYWMGPLFGDSAEDIPLDTQFLLMETSENGPYALMLPLVDSGFRASLEYGDAKEMEVIFYSESGDAVPSTGMRAVYVAVGTDPFELLKTGFRQVADSIGSFRTLDQKVLPSSVNDFGWCTWDAFYSKVHPSGILKGVAALKDLGVPPRNLILDDGWQQVAPHSPEWKEAKEGKGVAKENSGVLSRLFNAVLPLLAKLANNYYENYARRASHGSLPNYIWTFLSKTVLKSGIWDFFDSETDFGRQLDGFEPNHKFQSESDTDSDGSNMSLTELVKELKTGLNMKRVYCWHAMHGYWRGVSSDLGRSIDIDVDQVISKPTERLLRLEPQMGFDTISLFGVGLITNKPDLAKFYKHIHEPLAKAGIDGVKVDVQSGVSAAGNGVSVVGGPHISRMYTEAMENSVSEHFASDGNGAVDCINCMCHSTESLYRYKVTAVARASEDFFPGRPESHSVHLINVAYNSLFLGEICLPDWDMFHSKHESAELHAAARAIGGCPVYVSDVPGEHNATLLKKLVLPDGSVLRAQLPGRPTRDCLFVDVGRDGTSALKIWNRNRAGNGVVGAFHVQGVAWNFDTNENDVLDPAPAPVTASVRPRDVESLRHFEGECAVWSQRASSLQTLGSVDCSVRTRLTSKEWEIFTIAPIQTSGRVRWAPIGLGDMLNSGGALLDVGRLEEATTTEGQRGEIISASIVTRGPGRFVAFSQPAPSRIIIDGGYGSAPSELAFDYTEETGLLSFILPDERNEEAHQVAISWD